MPDDIQSGSVKIPNPFVTTYMMANDDEDILHFTGFRIRVTGTGNLLASFFDLDEITEHECVPLVMAETNKIEPFRLANFNTQRGMLRIGTSEINEVFSVARIIVFAKTLWTDYPA